MALTNFKSSSYSLMEPDAPKGFEEEMACKFSECFKERKFSEGVSLLLFYIIAKADQVNMDTFIPDKLEELEDLMKEAGESARILLSQYTDKETLSVRDLSRIRHLQHMIQSVDAIESESEIFGPFEFKNTRFNEEQSKLFLSDLWKYKNYLSLTGMELTSFHRCQETWSPEMELDYTEKLNLLCNLKLIEKMAGTFEITGQDPHHTRNEFHLDPKIHYFLLEIN